MSNWQCEHGFVHEPNTRSGGCPACAKKILDIFADPAPPTPARTEPRDATGREWETQLDVGCVSCPDCGFTFDATHTYSDGTYSCPCCAESHLRSRAQRLQEALEEAITHVASGRLASIGAMHNTYTPQISVATVERWRRALSPTPEGS